ncbi:MAG: hypothetical protein ACLRM0_16445, partial [[Clostridium] leptum]
MAFYHPIADGTKTQVFSAIPDPHCRHIQDTFYPRCKFFYNSTAVLMDCGIPISQRRLSGMGQRQSEIIKNHMEVYWHDYA